MQADPKGLAEGLRASRPTTTTAYSQEHPYEQHFDSAAAPASRVEPIAGSAQAIDALVLVAVAVVVLVGRYPDPSLASSKPPPSGPSVAPVSARPFLDLWSSV